MLDGWSVGDLEGVRVGSFDRGEMVGEPAGKAGQNVGQALAISFCFVVEMEAVTCVMCMKKHKMKNRQKSKG